jgi:hypothetical protein
LGVVLNFDVNLVQAGIGTGMVTARIPGAGIEVDFGKFVENHAPPVSPEAQSTVTLAGNLKEKGLGAASLSA